MMDKLPQFQLKRVYEDGSEEPPEIVPLLQLPDSTKMDRRGFLGAGLTISAVLGLISCARTIRPDGTEPIIRPDGMEPIIQPDGTEPIKTGSCTEGVKAHTDGVSSVSFSPDGNFLASGSSDKTVKLWEMPSGKLVATMGIYVLKTARLSIEATAGVHTEAVTSVSFSPDGAFLASGSFDHTVKLWEMPSGKLVATLKVRGVDSLSFSPDGKFLSSGSIDGSVKLWEMPSGKLVATLEGHTSGVKSVSFSPDGKWLASGSWDHTVKLWAMPSGKLVATLEGHTGRVASISFSPDGKWLASGGDNAKLWEMPSGKLVATLEGHTYSVFSVSFSPNGKLLASGGFDKTVKLWKMPSGKLAATLKGHTREVESISFSPDGKWLASGSFDNTVKLWEASRNFFASAPSGKFATCLFDPAALEEDKEVIQYTEVNQYGQIMSYSGPCGTPIPQGATCTCNCVPGTYSSRPSPSRPSSGGGGSYCTCNKVCTCIPVCQAHRILDSDPLIRVMAEESLLLMGEKEFDYMLWAASTAEQRVRQRIETVMARISQGERPHLFRWPSLEQCMERIDHPDPVAALMAATFMSRAASNEEKEIPLGVFLKMSEVSREGWRKHQETREKVREFVNASRRRDWRGFLA